MDEQIAALEATIAARRAAGDAATSYVARLARDGRASIAKKVGEEAVELALAAVVAPREAQVGEAADLFFHMLMLLADCGIGFGEVMDVLARREGMSGLAEKAARMTS